MKRPAVRCRCGHQVLAKEILRTDLYERPSGREYVYVKYRCKRCKRMGETFVAEHRWDWRMFEESQNELTESETELFSGQAPISSEELLDFHRQLTTIETPQELSSCGTVAQPEATTRDATPPGEGAKPLRPETGECDMRNREKKGESEEIIRPEDGASR